MNTEYTDIPKLLRGYYKEINGVKTENMERSPPSYQFVFGWKVLVLAEQKLDDPLTRPN